MEVASVGGASSLAQLGLASSGGSITGWDDDTVRRLLNQFANNPAGLLALVNENSGSGPMNEFIQTLKVWVQSENWTAADTNAVSNLSSLLGLLNNAVQSNPQLVLQLNPIRSFVAVLSPFVELARQGGIGNAEMSNVLAGLVQSPPSLAALNNFLFNPATPFVSNVDRREATIAALNAIMVNYPSLNSNGEIANLVKYVQFAGQLKSLESTGAITASDRISLLASFTANGLNVEVFKTSMLASSVSSSMDRCAAAAILIDFLKSKGILSASEAQSIGQSLYQASLIAFINAYGTNIERQMLAGGIPDLPSITGQALTETIAALVAKRTGRDLPSGSGVYLSLGVTPMSPETRLLNLETELTSVINTNFNNPDPVKRNAFKLYFTYLFDVNDPLKTGDNNPANDLIVNSTNAYPAMMLIKGLLQSKDVYVPSTLITRVLGNYAKTVINTVPGNDLAKTRLSAYESATNKQGEIDMFAISLVLTNNTDQALVLGVSLADFNAVFQGIDENAQSNLAQLSEFGNTSQYNTEFWSKQIMGFSKLTNKAALLESEKEQLGNESLTTGLTETRKAEITKRLADIDQEQKNIIQAMSELFQMLMNFLNKKENATRALYGG